MKNKMLKAAVESAGLEGIFTHVISADELRIYKLSARVYHLASQKMGVDQASIGFISSNSFDVVGAKAFGFWVCWVNRYDTHLDELDFMPDVTVPTLTELAEIMKK